MSPPRSLPPARYCFRTRQMSFCPSVCPSRKVIRFTSNKTKTFLYVPSIAALVLEVERPKVKVKDLGPHFWNSGAFSHIWRVVNNVTVRCDRQSPTIASCWHSSLHLNQVRPILLYYYDFLLLWFFLLLYLIISISLANQADSAIHPFGVDQWGVGCN